MKMIEAAGQLKGQQVVVLTSKLEVSGRLREVGEDFLNLDYATGKTAIIPLSQVVTLKEQ
jgi:hypothetical protein